MPAGRLYLAAVAGLAIATASAAWADRPTFAELFAKAEAQAAAGHRWSPPGDNMTETVAGMMDLIGTATPKQLEDLSALLEADAERLRQARESETPRRPGPANTAVVNKASPQVADPVSPRLINPGAAQPGNQVAPQMANPVAPQLANPVAPQLANPVAPQRGNQVAPQLANPVAPQLANPVAPQLANPVAPQPGQRAAELLARGRAAESQGDVSGARRIYATAVAQGSAAAARDLGRLYDPAYLKQTALGGIDPDPALARHWYERAVAMGDAEAGPLLQALAAR
jgi:TPR repeat protein